ncbi:MAG: Ig-like domain-containing protein [Flavobacteriaceae bacterium]|nr:Ig-like domain-containing protein [Flavobacteriaceae bacterium]
MKIFTQFSINSVLIKRSVLTFLLSIFAFNTIQAQCPTIEPEGVYNPKDDILITSYHQSIARTENGYITWGEDMASNGTGDPIMQEISPANGYNYTGAIVQYAVSGNTGGQAFLLTTTGLYAWGLVDEVVNSDFVSGSAFAVMALPGVVTATDVIDLFATSNAFVIITTTGEVWVASRESRVSGNTSTNTAIWQNVQTSAGVPLTDVFHVTGSDVALYAQQNDGDIFVWGNSVYLGDGNGASNYDYATQMTAPASTPTYISSYFNDTDTQHGVLALGQDGRIYGVGHNTANRIITETTGAVLNWETIKYSNGIEMTNVLQISTNQTSEQFSSAAAIVDGVLPSDPNNLYTWGNDNFGNIGHGNAGLVEFPSVPGGYTLGVDDAIYVSVGGHATTIYNKSTKTICFTGHVIDNSTGGLTGATATSFVCITVVNFDLCGVNTCLVDGISATNTSTCNDNGTPSNINDDTFTADITVTFTDAPVTGTLDLTGDGTASVSVVGLTSPHIFVGVILPANGSAISLTAAFSDDTACTFTNPTVVNAPFECSDVACPDVIPPGSPTAALTAADVTFDITNLADEGSSNFSTKQFNSITIVGEPNPFTDLLTPDTVTYSYATPGVASQEIIENGVIGINITDGPAIFDPELIAVNSSRNLNFYLNNNLTIEPTDYVNFEFSFDISSASNRYVIITERGGNNTMEVQAIDAAGNLIGTPRIVDDLAGGTTTYIATGHNNDNGQQIYATIYPLTAFVGPGVPINGVRLTQTGAPSDGGDGKIFIVYDPFFLTPPPTLLLTSTVTQPVCPSNEGTITIDAIDNGGGAIEYSINGAVGPWQASNVFTIGPGNYTIAARYVSAPSCINIGNTAFVLVDAGCIIIDAVDDSTTGINGTTGATGVIDVFTNDTLNGVAVVPADVTLTETVADPNGYLTLNADGTVDVGANTPPGTYQLTYQICENLNPTNCDTATATVVVPNTTDAINDINDTFVDLPVSGNVLTNDEDEEGGNQTVDSYDAVTSNGGIVAMNPDGTYLYTPPAGFEGTDTFSYTICDDQVPQACDTATVTIEVSPEPSTVDNNLPVANDDTATTEVNTPVDGSLLPNDFDPDGDTITVNTTPITNPTNGSVVINPDGTYTYTPDPGFEGEDSFVYEICDDGTPQECTEATVTITVLPDDGGANDTYANDDAYNGNIDTPITGGVLDNDNDPESNNQTVNPTPIDDVDNGTLVLNADGTFTYTPDPGFSGTDSFVYEVCDDGSPVECDEATVYITINPTINPSMSLEKTGTYDDTNGNGIVDVGDTIEYAFTVINTGDVDLTNVTISDPLLVSPNGSISGGPIALLAVGTNDATTFTGSYMLTQADIDNGSFTNVATVTGTDPDGGTVSDDSDDPTDGANNDNNGDGDPDDPTITNLDNPMISVEKVGVYADVADGITTFVGIDAGDTITYTFTVTNTGNVDVDNLVIDDTTIGVVGLVVAPSMLTPGAVGTATYVYTITQADIDAGEIVNTATASGTDPNGDPVSDTSDDPNDLNEDDPNNDGEPDDPTITDLTNPRVELEKVGTYADTDGNGVVNVGDIITYAFTVTNTGNVTINNLMIDDATIGVTGLAVVSGTLLPGQTGIASYDYAITQADIDAGGITNTATVTGQDPDGNDVVDTSDDPADLNDDDPNNDGDPDDPTITNLNNPMLSIEKTGMIVDTNGNGIVGDPGDDINYVFTVTNTGNVDLTGITVSDPLFTVVGGPIDLVTGANDTTTFTGTYTITGADTLAGEVINVAVATGTGMDMNGNLVDVSDTSDDPSDLNDDDPNNDGEPDDPTIIDLPAINDISLVKTVTDGNYSPIMGEQITFDIVVTNDGPMPATGVTVLDLLPSGYTYISHGGGGSGTYDPVTGMWTGLDDMPAGTSLTLSITVEVLMTGDYVNVAEVMAANELDIDSPHGNGILAEDDMDNAVVTPVEPTADLELTKIISDGNDTPYVGDEITFDISITNVAGQEATGVEVMELLASGYTYVSHSVSSGIYDFTTGVWTDIDNIPEGSSETLTITAIVNVSGDYTNTAEIMLSDLLDPDSVPGNGDPLEDDISTIDTIVPLPVVDISVTKEVDNTTPIAGDEQVTFTVRVSNDGPSDATGVEILDLLPSGFTYVSSTTTAGTYDDFTGIWNVGGLANGITETMTVTVEVLSLGDWVNIAELVAVNEFDQDSEPDNGVSFEDDYAEVAVVPEMLLTIPEGFTPNGDGTNDVFEIEHLQVLYPNFSMEIVNRWGNIVYKYTHNGDEASTPQWWDGFSTGRMTLNDTEMAPTGTYFYAIYFNKDGREPQSGWIYLRK